LDQTLTSISQSRKDKESNVKRTFNAAQQTGLSPKTLRRKLLKDNTSYSEIVGQLRFELAQSKLKKSAGPVHVIARELGYEHHANFTRAFKRMCGITPQEYRNRVSSTLSEKLVKYA